MEACKECNKIDEQSVIKRKERGSANLRRMLSLGPVHFSSVVCYSDCCMHPLSLVVNQRELWHFAYV